MPEPYRSLLVHDRDMTSTLAEYHGEDLVLRVDRRELDEPWLFRKVALLGERSRRPVEFGAIRIDLSGFGDRHRSQIEDGIRPLGALLLDGAGPFLSAPTGFFHIRTTREIEAALDLSGPARLWGRRNLLTRPDGRLLAEVVEILPPLGAEPTAEAAP